MTEEERKAKRKAAMDLVLADKQEERLQKEKAAVERAAAKKAAELKAKQEAETAAIEAAEREAAAIEAAKQEAEKQALAEAAAAQAEAEAATAAEEAAARAAAEAAAVAAREAEEAAALEAAELKRTPAWVHRLNQPDFVHKIHKYGSDEAYGAESHRSGSPARESFRASGSPRGVPSAELQPPAPGAIIYSRNVSGDRNAPPSRMPVKVHLADWDTDAPRAVANVMLLLRQGVSLDSKIVGKLPPGCHAFVLETKEVSPGTHRSLITATASTAAPLGWVTATKNGTELLAGVDLPVGGTAGLVEPATSSPAWNQGGWTFRSTASNVGGSTNRSYVSTVDAGPAAPLTFYTSANATYTPGRIQGGGAPPGLVASSLPSRRTWDVKMPRFSAGWSFWREAPVETQSRVQQQHQLQLQHQLSC